MSLPLILADLDGTLVSSTHEIHYEALNRALKIKGHKQISRTDHNQIYASLPTKDKLKLYFDHNTELSELSKPLEILRISDLKQEITFELLGKAVQYDQKIVNCVREFKSNGFQFHVATNSVRKTTELVLKKLGILELVDYYVSNEDVTRAKPDPEMLIKCINHSGLEDAVMIGDSVHDEVAAKQAEIRFIRVSGPIDITYNNLITKIYEV